MNSFQRKSLYAALAGVGALGVTGTADAVNVNPNGLGQVLIYPYYTVNTDSRGNAFNSLISVVNSTNSAKTVKVRFLEGKDSKEVLDFNLFLSKYDVWTAAVIPSPVTAGGRVFTTDQSCTIPSNTLLQAGVDFVNFAYTGSDSDGADPGLDRTKEGYVEMIEMSTLFTTSCTYADITHIAGVPKDCAGISDAQALSDSISATGGLFGAVQIINVDSGGDYDADAVALERFNDIPGGNYQFANSVSPQLTDSFPKTSIVFDAVKKSFPKSSDLNIYISDWSASSNSADTVSAVLMHDSVLNEFILDSATNSGTDWVVTFPTKRFYVVAPGTGPATKLFENNFNKAAGSCDDVTLNIYDREEQTTSTPTTFSPPPPSLTNAICWEANIITFNNSNVLGSQNSANINTGFQNGWLNLGFAPPTSPATYHTLGNTTGTTHIYGAQGQATVGETKTYLGLPVVGFAVASYTNGVLTVSGTEVLANYGSKFGQKATTTIVN